MDIVFSSTTQLAAAILSGDLSATEVLEAHLAQIASHNPALNAVTTDYCLPPRGKRSQGFSLAVIW